MKRNLSPLGALLMALALIASHVRAAEPAIPTAFTYQGRLNADGGPASGLYDFEFRLFGGETNATAVAGPSNASAVWVTNGSFQAEIDFGTGVFTGEERWLEIAVQCTECDGLPVTLSPRQKLTATPQALFALNAGGLATYAGAPLDITLNGERVIRFQPATSPTLGFLPNIIGGVGSYVTTQNHGVTVAGGGYHDVEDESYFSTVSGGLSNWLARGTVFSVIAGGEGNQIADGSHGVIGGGAFNRMSVFGVGPFTPQIRLYDVIGGGVSNVQGGAMMSTIGGGAFNRFYGELGNPIYAGTIGGGIGNNMQAGEYGVYESTISGGRENSISLARNGTIGGGGRNRIAGESSFASIGGGGFNLIHYSDNSTISGGYSNQIAVLAHNGVIGGGVENLIEPNVVNATIGGGSGNEIQTPEGRRIENATIGGGGGNIVWSAENATIGGGISNRINLASYGAFIGGGEANIMDVYCNYAVIAGGSGNSMRFADNSVIGGGRRNRMGDSARYSTIAGGASNVIGRDAFRITISGGSLNTVVRDAHGATIGGGNGNLIGEGAVSALISGGESNQANGPYSTVPGGRLNAAGGSNSFAAGFRARATNDGAFVWADLQEADFTSTGTNQFLVRASGGVGINTDSPQFALHVNGDAGKPGGGAWSVASDERLKKDIRPLEQALARLLKLHGVTYEYKNPAAIHELAGQQTGMIAQEVEKVFPEWVETGRDGMKRLSVRGFEALTVEALRELRTEKDEQIRARDSVIEAMEKRLAALERLMSQSGSQR